MKKRLLAFSLLLAFATLGFGAAQGTILEVARADDRFEALVAAVDAAGLAETLGGEGPFTLFVPTDQAFNRLAGLEELLAQPEVLRRLVLLHVVPGVVTAAAAAAESPLATALEGAALQVRVVDGTLYVGDAIVTITDVPAANGVIHVIDTVLTPPAE